MLTPIRHASYSAFLVLICLGVLFQMLGAPITIWNLDGSQDDFVSGLLMGIAFHSAEPYTPPLFSYLFTPIMSTADYNFLYERMFFHPPPFTS